MSKNQYPTFDICNLNANKNENDLLNIDRFKGYISSNPHLEEIIVIRIFIWSILQKVKENILSILNHSLLKRE